ncbi:hypothetical protein A7P54_03675 [Acinetobacter sp. Ac_3412]|uniref:hypothetical protein n=1 Tax=Acinetobacter sp. Ac_3412 TaxID=1848935 RepID=UPI00148F6853|nr:hypothetical protein [Acinetobacter sp. Ac_3412]NNP75518.1 hypothetical protein [Acinetobacter sp. Ac_3412]
MTWKKQQNYSFKRDKVFDLELIINKIKGIEIAYLDLYTSHLLTLAKQQNPSSLPHQLTILSNDLLLAINEYSTAKEALDIINVNYNKGKIISKNKMQANFSRVRSILSKNNTNVAAVINASKAAQAAATLQLDEMLVELSKIRENI